MRFPRTLFALARASKMRSRAVALALSLASPLTYVALARADGDSQRDRLDRIAYELSRLEEQAAEAGKQSAGSARVRFRFDWLAHDLALVRRGIEDHLDAQRQPRPAPPLRGDYRQ